MTEIGKEYARAIKDRAFPLESGYYREAREIDPKYENVCIGVDRREGGGKKLHEFCNKLVMTGAPFVVCPFEVGDYLFFTGLGETGTLDKVAPVLVERKSIVDVADSIK